jgi:hypothetical protein
VIFPENEMENPLSPHCVMCAKCVRYACDQLDEAENTPAEVVDGSVEDDTDEVIRI